MGLQRQDIDLSVIVCAYEQPVTVPLILKCLLAQKTSSRFEIIVCDDGSSSDFFASCRDIIQASFVPIYWVWQQDQGYRVASSINNGIRLASGKYIVFIDGDMVPGPSFLESHLQAHARPGRLVAGRRRWRSLGEVESRLPLSPQDVWALCQGAGAINPNHKAMEWLEQKVQARLAVSGRPWLACFSCNLSLERSDAIYLDEFFKTWGLEDTEMAYRLSAVEGLEVHFEEGLEAYHLANRESNPMLTRRHDDIVKYLRNFCYFLDKWPDAFTGYPMDMDLLPFELDPETNQWRTTRPTLNAPKRDFQVFEQQLRDWLQQNGVYPQPESEAIRS